jgi:hypothetical protein
MSSARLRLIASRQAPVWLGADSPAVQHDVHRTVDVKSSSSSSTTTTTTTTTVAKSQASEGVANNNSNGMRRVSSKSQVRLELFVAREKNNFFYNVVVHQSVAFAME